MGDKALLIMKTSPELLYSLLDDETKEKLLNATKNIVMAHCYICHSDFVKDQNRKCREKKETCTAHGIHRHSDKVWWSDDADDCACMESKPGDEKCVYSCFGKMCMPAEDLTTGFKDVKYREKFALEVLGCENFEKKTNFSHKFKLLFDLEDDKLPNCENEGCMAALDMVADLFKQKGWDGKLEEYNFSDDDSVLDNFN